MSEGGKVHSTPRWTLENVRQFLFTYGRAPRELAVEQMESWSANVVLRLEADGERLVLRQYGVTPPDEVRWELAVLEYLRKHGFPTVGPLSRTDTPNDCLGEFLGKPAILYPFFEGQNGCGVESPLAIAQT
ncbi:MAG TPA: phosphotransferase, partial [Chloroflexota bacterium]